MSDQPTEIQAALSGLTEKDLLRAPLVLQIMEAVQGGQSQAEACEAAGVAVRTYRRWLTESEGLQGLRMAAAQAWTQSLLMAITALPASIAQTALRAQGTDTGARDQLAAQKELARLVEAFVGAQPSETGKRPVRPESEDDEDAPDEPASAIPGTFKPGFTLSGPGTRQIPQEDAGEMIGHAVSGNS